MSEKKKPTNQQDKQSSPSSTKKPTVNKKDVKEASKTTNTTVSKSQNSATDKTPLSASKDGKDLDKSSTTHKEVSNSKEESNTPQNSTTNSTSNAKSKTESLTQSTSSKQMNTQKPSSASPNKPTSTQQKISSTQANNNSRVTSKTSSNSTTPPPSKPSDKSNGNGGKGGNGLSLLALIIALAAAGMSGYTLLNGDKSDDSEVNSIKQRLSNLENDSHNDSAKAEIKSLNEQVSTLQTKLSELGSNNSVSEEKISKIIQQQVSAQGKQNVTPEQIKQYIDSELAKASQSTTQSSGISEQQVQTLIKQALASFSQDTSNAPKFDFSEEIAKVEQSQKNAQQAVAQINQRADEIQRSLKQQASSIQAQISQVEQQANPYPILNLLRLANGSAKLGNAAPAALYLEQASSEFNSFNLNQQPYASFKDKIEQKAKEFRSIAKESNTSEVIDSLIANVDEWSFKQANAVEQSKQENKDSGFVATLKGVGKDILNNTVTVTKNDEEGISWINENAQLQQLIRQNIRLDLSYTRNALISNDTKTAETAIKRLQENITKYFDKADEKVAQALETLANIEPQQKDFPNLSDLIEQFSQAATKE